jgi:hypothetical protein
MNLKIIHGLVYTIMIMIKSPTTSRVQAVVNPMTFFFSVNVIGRWFIDGQKILVLSFLRMIVFIGFTSSSIFIVHDIKDLLYNSYRFPEKCPFEVF